MRKEVGFGIFIFVLVLLSGLLLIPKKEFSVTGKRDKEIFTIEKGANKPLLKEDRSQDSSKKQAKEESLPVRFKLEVPFTPQAPFGVWDKDHNDACEEAAILMVNTFLKKGKLTPEIADKEILDMINYQNRNWGDHHNLEAEEVARLAEEFYDYKNVKTIYDISIEDIKKQINKGTPVILPTAGRLLFGPLSEGKNPYYRSPGPVYHMLVGIGWDDREQELIVNDPGTRRGENFTFKYRVLDNALHVWNRGEVLKGRKVMIVISE
ncbi:C39 family peptidase [bacterium]|nr:C39 family peptidase [bacterium]